VLKISGQSLQGSSGFGINPDILEYIASEITLVRQEGVEVVIVVGGGNFFRGVALSHAGLHRITGDHLGMLATIMNALAMRDVFEQNDISTRVMSAIPMGGIVEHYDHRLALQYLKQGDVLICAAGTGNPLVTTDTAASLRAIELQADVLMKSTHVGGVYDQDPKKYPNATMYHNITFDEVIQKGLGVMDLSAFCQCRDHHLPIRIFDMTTPGALLAVVHGQDVGTLIRGDIVI
jgi:uridylate kinase